jgi:TolB-like protein
MVLRTLSKLIVVAALLASGCIGETRVNAVPGSGSGRDFRLAVLDFQASEGTAETKLGGADIHAISDAGQIVADAVGTALVRVSAFRVVERMQAARIIEEMGLTPHDVLLPENLKRFAEEANLDGVLVGYVSDFHWWQIALTSGSRVAFTARLVSTQTGEVLWSASCHRSRREDHSEVLYDACAAMVSELRDALPQ